MYLTPASISYLTQFALTLSIFIFLAIRIRIPSVHSSSLIAFFGFASLFLALMTLDASLPPYERLLVVYLENTVLAIGLVFLLYFAYHFPQPFPQHRWESRLSQLAAGIYFLFELMYTLYRYGALLMQDTVYYRPTYLTAMNAFILLWVPFAFLRQTIAADPRQAPWWQKLWSPQGRGAHGARNFIFVFGLVFLVGLINLLRDYWIASTAVFNATFSLSVLAALWLFSTNYINFISGGVSILAKISILILTLFLAILGSIGWIISPPYIATYKPNLKEHQTYRFTPTPTGGYEVKEIDFYFEPELGNKLHVTIENLQRNAEIDFTFPFYGTVYHKIYVASSGAITLGQPFWQPNMQAKHFHIPAIFALLFEPDLAGHGEEGIYVNVKPDRLVATWYQLPAQYWKKTRFTFQVILYTNGVFDITYQDLPETIPFSPDETPSASPWLRGITAGRGENIHHVGQHLLNPVPPEASLIIENYYMEFRTYVHKFILPLMLIIIIGSLALVMILPTLLHYSIIKPLDALSAGVHRMERGELDFEIPVSQSEDELSLLTAAFNKMSAQLYQLTTNLENMVNQRTAELAAQNLELDAFAHTVAHDLKNPIGIIMGYAEILADEQAKATPNLEVSRNCLEYIIQTSTKLERITEELMLLTGVRKQEITPEPLDMISIIGEAMARLQLVIREEGAQITLVDPAEWPTAMGYAPWIEEVWTNYISNAIKYGGCPPVITIGADPHPIPKADDTTPMVRFWVHDNGEGLDEEKQRQLFIPFTRLEQARAQGHGLGLSIVRRIIEKLGGDVGVESAPGAGSTFYFTLPLAPSSDQASIVPSNQTSQAPGNTGRHKSC